MTTKEKIDAHKVNSSRSEKKGLLGFTETTIRILGPIGGILVIIPIIFLYAASITGALLPSILLYTYLKPLLISSNEILNALFFAASIGFGFSLSTIALLFVVPLVNLPILIFLKPYRGPWQSLESLPWLYHNALTYLVRYTVLEFVTPSPLNILFFKMMGMKIGKNVLLNTTNISDPRFITIEKNVTIGGSAHLMAHYGMNGFLIIDKLHLKRGSMIGLKANLFGSVVVGEKATVLPNSVVLPKTVIENGEIFPKL